MYNGVAPSEDNSIVFLTTVSETTSMEQSDKLSGQRLSLMENSNLLGNFGAFESNFYTGELLQKVALVSHLKGWFSDYFKPGYARDLAGLRDEYFTNYHSGSALYCSHRRKILIVFKIRSQYDLCDTKELVAVPQGQLLGCTVSLSLWCHDRRSMAWRDQPA